MQDGCKSVAGLTFVVSLFPRCFVGILKDGSCFQGKNYLYTNFLCRNQGRKWNVLQMFDLFPKVVKITKDRESFKTSSQQRLVNLKTVYNYTINQAMQCIDLRKQDNYSVKHLEFVLVKPAKIHPYNFVRRTEWFQHPDSAQCSISSSSIYFCPLFPFN